MATAQNNQEEYDDLLTCTICLETFNVPKYLPCLHTFCESCIGTYIVSSVKNESEKNGLSCPVCRKIVQVQEFEGNIEKWGEQLPKNHLIMSMLDKRAIGKSEKFCNVCGAKEKAVFWCCVCKEALCTPCQDYHRKFKMLSNHQLIPLQEMQCDIPSLLSENIPCEKHKNKYIEIFCVDHAQPCCTVCATVNHRKCASVVAIEEAISGIKESSKATCKELSEHFTQTSTLLGETIKDVETNASSIENEGQVIMEEIDGIQNEIVKHVTKIGQKLKDELTMKTKETVIRLKDKMTEMSSLKATVDNWINILDSSTKHGSELQYLIDLNKLIPRKKALESEIKKLTPIPTAKLKFKQNRNLKTFTKKVEYMGEICMSMPELNMRSGKIKVIQVIDVTNGVIIDDNDSYGSGIFTKDNIVLTDHKNKRVIFYDNTGILEFDVKLPNGPYDVTSMGDMKLAVSSTNIAKEIYIINVVKREVERSIIAANYVGGLRYIISSGEFICGHSGVLRWLDMTSGKLKKETKTKGDTYYLYASKTGDYICADGNKAVSCTVRGETKFTYSDNQLFSPRGIDVDFEGNVYICGYESNNVHQITSEGSLIRIINSTDLGISKPWVIRFRPNSNQFLLTSSNSGKVSICEIY